MDRSAAWTTLTFGAHGAAGGAGGTSVTAAHDDGAPGAAVRKETARSASRDGRIVDSKRVGGAQAAQTVEENAVTVRVLAEESHVGAVVGSHAGAADDVTYTMLWPASHALAEFLCAALPSQARTGRATTSDGGLAVVELGAGAGHVGLCAALVAKRSAAGSLTAITDGAGGAVERIRVAALENGLNVVERASAPRERESHEVVACELKWGDTEGCSELDPQLSRGFDMVVAAEVVYPATTEATMALLFSTVRSLLRAPLEGERAGDAPRWAPPYFVLLYVERRKETTRILLNSAWTARFTVEHVPTGAFTSRSLVMEPKLLLFRAADGELSDDDLALQREGLEGAFPLLWSEEGGGESASDSSSVNSGEGWGPRTAFFDGDGAGGEG